MTLIFLKGVTNSYAQSFLANSNGLRIFGPDRVPELLINVLMPCLSSCSIELIKMFFIYLLISSVHFLSSLDLSELAKAAKKKLQSVSISVS